MVLKCGIIRFPGLPRHPLCHYGHGISYKLTIGCSVVSMAYGKEMAIHNGVMDVRMRDGPIPSHLIGLVHKY